jgi:hypothetical protein
MFLTSTQMIQQLRADFEKLLGLVTGPEAQTATLDQMERSLLRLGFKLLQLFVTTRVQAETHVPQPGVGKMRLPYHSQKPIDYFSIFGKLTFARAYFYHAGQPGVCPLDQALSLPQRCYSDLLIESAELLAVDSAYDKSLHVLTRLLGVTVPELALETQVAEHSQTVKAFYRQRPKFLSTEEEHILIAQAYGASRNALAQSTFKQRRQKDPQKRVDCDSRLHHCTLSAHTPRCGQCIVQERHCSTASTDTLSQASLC